MKTKYFLFRMQKFLFLLSCLLIAACTSSGDDGIITPPVDEHANVNANDPGAATEGKAYVTDYAIPHLDAANLYVEHTVSYNNETVFNYALEWNAGKKHAAWVAFTFDDVTRQNTVKRTDAWNVDPLLPATMQTTEAMHKSDGFDKGHLVASYDRVFSKEANAQTFYYSNMSPQFNSFNGGFWASFEGLVQKWARSGKYKKLYVAKGGTLNRLLTDFTGTRKGADGILPQTDAQGLTKHGLACPKYYFMAILAYKGGDIAAKSSWQAIGFWMEHRDDYGYEYDNFAPSDVMKNYVASIDELEKNTGIDFFCNLPDVIEDEVEKASAESDWNW
ncbi:DNA/RNA non-specific endonuclease [Bacteroides helcogenes]|uniref:DNA/RNA non-specific endonuclease n=1 Tax=Bacteroides helcogenes (strain ATCC 35417 / DSM 20613 / JCM 6297 / CCUG 15421 / P 36-108) TaxID=693979 RepID=E6SWD3_BACT6|nr:DNA/RNA non-specific endonuclease [Bacteroides helcogenes]ADV44594.1 DNA/RNA non-specific endonuclease [Bacteroides helcogenes P 36-108]MDY5238883.1 DNA/RNA non-specific endonuclease [Bacteroides helcogenes]